MKDRNGFYFFVYGGFEKGRNEYFPPLALLKGS